MAMKPPERPPRSEPREIAELKRLKQDERTRSIPVVVVTSSNQDPDVKTAYDLGANSYVVKPVDFESFMKTMSQLGFYWLMINQVSV